MRAEDFSDRSPGRLVPTIGGVVAFVPDPIPKSVDLPPQSILLLTRAENAIGRLVGTTARLVNPFLIGSPLLHKEAILSSRIEGTVTTPEQLVMLEAGSKPILAGASPDSAAREVLNYIEAMRHGLSRLGELPMCLRLMREIHRVLLEGVRGDRDLPGEFRKSQNWIGRRGDPIERARFVPPPPPEMEKGLDDLEKYLNSSVSTDTPLLVQLALVHYQFEAIHPFRDGNGRIGRLLIPLSLCSHGRIGSPLLYLSGFFEHHRDEYMDLLLVVSQKGDWLGWVNFFLLAVYQSAEEAIRQAEGLLSLRDNYHQRFQRARSSALLQKLIDELFQSPSITIGRAAALLKVTPAAAAYNIRKLEAAEILREATGRKRDQVFVAHEIVAFMYDTHEESSSNQAQTAT